MELAIDDVLNSVDRNITRTEQEKLCYFAIQEFDLPITYSWYLAGAYTRVAGEPDEAPKRKRATNAGYTQDHGEDDEVQKYRNFFASETFFDDYHLRQVWFTDKFEFLRDFYREYAGDDYTDLYLVSTNIRECLENLDDTIERDNTNHSLADFGATSETKLLSKSDETEFRLYVSDLHLELAQINELSEITNLLTRGTDVIEQVYATLTTLESITREQEVVLQDIGAYFYYGVWRYPALYISTQTAEGPNKQHLIADHESRFAEFHEELLTRQARLQERCNNVGLYPEAGHHSERVDEEQVAHLQEMAKEVIQGGE